MKRRSNSKNMAAALLVVARKIDAVDEVQRSIKLVLELLKKDQSEISNYRFVHRTKAFDHVRNQHIKDYLPEVFEDIQETYTTMAMPS